MEIARIESGKRIGKLKEKIKNTGIRRVEEDKYNEKRTCMKSYSLPFFKRAQFC